MPDHLFSSDDCAPDQTGTPDQCLSDQTAALGFWDAALILSDQVQLHDWA